MELTCCLNGEKAPTAVEAKRSVKVFILRLRRRRIDFMEAALLRPLSLLLCNSCSQQVGGPCLLVYFRITNGVDHRHRRFKRAPTTTKKQKIKNRCKPALGCGHGFGIIVVWPKLVARSFVLNNPVKPKANENVMLRHPNGFHSRTASFHSRTEGRGIPAGDVYVSAMKRALHLANRGISSPCSSIGSSCCSQRQRSDPFARPTFTLLMLRSVLVIVAASSLLGRRALVQCEVTASSVISPSYGVDVSWPTHHHFLFDEPFSRLDSYREFMDGCYEQYSVLSCEANEQERVSMNLRQPPVQTNYSHAGFAKVPIPATSWQLLQDVWAHNTSSKPEYWDEANIYTNHWESPTSILGLDRFLTIQQRKVLLRQIQEVLERWTQTTLTPTSLYGIRVYHRNAVLAPHVDRLPLIVSAILNVAQSVEEEWALEVIGHDGIAVNVTMQPGEMILYESASVIHGRPFPLQGDYFANIFVHFEPIGYTQGLEQRMLRQQHQQDNDAKALFEQALEKEEYPTTQQREASKKVPHYIKDDSIEAQQWKQDFVFVREYPAKRDAEKQHRVKGVTSAHVVAANGNLRMLQEVEKQNPESLFKSDSNGWYVKGCRIIC